MPIFIDKMIPDILSHIELYYSPHEIKDNIITLAGEDFKHAAKVMRHSVNDEIFITDGKGCIFKSVILKINKDNLEASIISEKKYSNKFANYFFCLPKLKSPDRFEYALEKSAELGITNFIVFNSNRTIVKGEKLERWNKILLAAMKQSLRCFLPEINTVKTLGNIKDLSGEKILFEQHSKRKLKEINFDPSKNYYFIFGPEGGLDDNEIGLFEKDIKINLSDNRLRSETAAAAAAVILASRI
jgi:16S rRNA (uracil1498-N3)-methyltransferase